MNKVKITVVAIIMFIILSFVFVFNNDKLDPVEEEYNNGYSDGYNEGYAKAEDDQMDFLTDEISRYEDNYSAICKSLFESGNDGKVRSENDVWEINNVLLLKSINGVSDCFNWAFSLKNDDVRGYIKRDEFGYDLSKDFPIDFFSFFYIEYDIMKPLCGLVGYSEPNYTDDKFLKAKASTGDEKIYAIAVMDGVVYSTTFLVS